MKRLVSVNNLTKKEWLMYRKKGITGTDAASIVNMNPYRSAFDVYQDKITDEIDEYDNETMRQGRDFEEYIALRFMEETGLKVRRANAIYYNKKHPFMLADFDRLVVGQRAGLECKCVSPFSAHKWIGEEEKIPIHYQLQVQHYLAVSGYDCWYIAALIYGQDFVIRKIERDEELIKDLIKIEKRFWNYNVLSRNVPDPDGSNRYTEALKERFWDTNKENEIQIFGLEGELKRRDEIKNVLEKLEKEKLLIEQKIQLQLGQSDAVYGQAGAYHISWVPTVTKRVDTGRLKKELPEIYNEYLYESRSKRFTVKKQSVNAKAA